MQILKQWLESLPKLPSHYCRSSSSKLYLEPGFNSIIHIYRLYKTFCEDSKTKYVLRWKFSEEFNSMKVSLFQPSKDRCDICIGNEQKSVNDVDIAFIDKKQRGHSKRRWSRNWHKITRHLKWSQ